MIVNLKEKLTWSLEKIICNIVIFKGDFLDDFGNLFESVIVRIIDTDITYDVFGYNLEK